MMACIIGSADTWHTRMLTAAFSLRGVSVRVVPATSFVARVGQGGAVESPDGVLDDASLVLVRTIPAGSLEQVIFRMDVLHVLEAIGVPVVNPPKSIERAVDKFLTSKLLELHGIPTPRTLVTQSLDQAMEGFRLWDDVVVKPLFGGEGRGMVRVSDPDVAFRTFRALQLGRYVYYLQEYIPHGCEDIRAFVLHDHVVAAMARQGDTWKTNVAQGAVPAPLVPSPEVVELSVRASAALGAVYAGVDLIRASDGRLYVVEVNSMPGWRGLQATTQVEIAQVLVDALLQTHARPTRPVGL